MVMYKYQIPRIHADDTDTRKAARYDGYDFLNLMALEAEAMLYSLELPRSAWSGARYTRSLRRITEDKFIKLEVYFKNWEWWASVSDIAPFTDPEERFILTPGQYAMIENDEKRRLTYLNQKCDFTRGFEHWEHATKKAKEKYRVDGKERLGIDPLEKGRETQAKNRAEKRKERELKARLLAEAKAEDQEKRLKRLEEKKQLLTMKTAEKRAKRSMKYAKEQNELRKKQAEQQKINRAGIDQAKADLFKHLEEIKQKAATQEPLNDISDLI